MIHIFKRFDSKWRPRSERLFIKNTKTRGRLNIASVNVFDNYF